MPPAADIESEVRLAGTLTACLSVVGAPAAALNEQGQLVGYNVSFASEIAVRLGLDIATREPLFDALIDRTMRRSRRLGLSQAICQLRRVDDRLLVLFVHLADRWGRVRDDGLLVPLRLTQETLARLVGARRPTVSLALSRLKERGLLVRQPGGWLLTRSPGEPSAGEALGEGEHPA